MNKLSQLNCHYITSNKTIETISVSNGIRNKVFLIYNYQGVSYRVFSSKQKLKCFWVNEAEEDHHFSTEDELDNYLEQINF